MRKYLGNVTMDKSRQVEENSAREKLRQEFLLNWKRKMAAIKGKEHIEDMAGKYDISQSVLYLFSNDGSPPPNISPEDFKKQFKRLEVGRRWLWTVSKELERKLDKIDPDRYREDNERKRRKEQDRTQKKEKAWLDYVESQPQTLNLKIRDSVHEVLQKRQKPKELKKTAERDRLNSHVLGTRQIEQVLRYMFSDYIVSSLYAVTDAPDNQYQAITDELESMNIMMLEIDIKLRDLTELIDAKEDYLGRNT